MMLKVIFLLLTALSGIVVSHFLVGQPSSLLLQTQNYTIQINLTLFILLWLCSYIVLTLLCSLLGRLFMTANVTRNWLRRKRSRLAKEQFETGLQQLLMKNYAQSLQSFQSYSHYTPHNPLPYLFNVTNYLALEQVDQAKHQLKLASQYLTKHDTQFNHYQQLQVALQQQEYPRAQSLLESLLQHNNTSGFLQFALTFYLNRQHYSAATTVLAKLNKRTEFPRSDYQALLLKVYSQWMNSLLSDHGCQALINWWGEQKKNITQQPQLQTLLVELAINGKQLDFAEKTILKYNKHATNLALLKIITTFSLTHPVKITELIQNKLQLNPNDWELKRLLSYSLSQQKQWPLAITLLSSYLNLYPNPLDYCQLSKLYQQVGEEKAALKSRDYALKYFIHGTSSPKSPAN